MEPLTLWKAKHPWYEDMEADWTKYRLTYQGGRAFINQYLQKFSKRESDEDFATRKSISYCPAFAAACINDIKNSIYQRMAEITRTNGDKTYQDAITGKDGGVDLHGGTMNNFIGQLVLPELLVMARVGIYIDMPEFAGELQADFIGKSPYLYIFTAEQIPCWSSCYVDGQEILTALLLYETNYVVDEATGLVTKSVKTCRHLILTDDGVDITSYNEKGEVVKHVLIPDMKRIPFVVAHIRHSLLKDVADYQIALLNMESADVSYILRANVPFYTEQYDPRANAPHLIPGSGGNVDPAAVVQADAQAAKAREIQVGPVSGRRYPVGTEAPAFIHPSSEPLKASMDKEAQMKSDIRHLVNLALTSVEPKFASAESKQMDDRSLESGLSYIGLELERVERETAKIWAAYVDPKKIATIKYPRKYSLKTDKDRREDAKQYSELMGTVPSTKGKKEIAKLIISTLLEQKVEDKLLEDIKSEIEKAEFLTSDAKDIQLDVTAGLVSAVTASTARGYDGEKEVPIAQEEHSKRLAEIAKSQTAGIGAARGVKDGPDDAKLEKDDSQKNKDKLPAGADPTRGENK